MSNFTPLLQAINLKYGSFQAFATRMAQLAQDDSAANISNPHDQSEVIDEYQQSLFDIAVATANQLVPGSVTDENSNDFIGMVGGDINPNPTNNESMQHKKLYNKVLLNISESDYNQAKINLEKIFEAKLRARIATSLQQVDEGLFDRLSARAAGFGAKIKSKAQNIGTRVGSSVKAIGQNVAGAATGKGFSTGQATVDAANKDIAANDPRKAAKAAQANNIIASFAKDLSTLYPSINPQKLLSNLRTQLNLAKP